MRTIALFPVALVLAACARPVEPIRVPAAPVAAIDQPGMGAAVSGLTEASGWAVHPQGTIKRIDLLLDGRVTGEAVYGIERPDVCRVFIDRPSCPNVGWRGTVDLTRVPPGAHQLRLRVTGPFGERTETPPRPILVLAPSRKGAKDQT
jgi:hypothetical protein